MRRAHAGWQEVAALVVLYGVYELVRGFRNEDLIAATENARHLVRLERSLGIHSEHAVQQFSERIPLLGDALAIMYPGLHVVGTIGVLVWMYHRRSRAFPLVRTTLILMTALALVVYVLYPVAPPRLALGFVDTVSQHGPLDLSSRLLGRFYNPVAAVPSLHLGYAVLVGGAIAWQAHVFAFRLAGALYPFVALFVIVATGNHFYVDAAAGAAVAVVATLAAWTLTRHEAEQRASGADEVEDFREVAVGQTDDGVRRAVIDGQAIGLSVDERRAGEDDVRHVPDLLVAGARRE
jgi:hypothetical protein